MTRNLSVPERHMVIIAKANLRMSDIGALILGGPTKAEAREFLRSVGIDPTKIENDGKSWQARD